ncbi:MAG: hypothetical protein Q9172_005396 [Xanthocarpia lactea]
MEGTLDAQRSRMATATIESSKRFLIHTQDQPNPSSPTSLQLQPQPTPTDPSQSGGPMQQMSVLSSGRPSSPSKGEIASSGTSSSQATDEAPAVSMAILDSQVASVHITQSLAIETGSKSFEVPIIGTSSNTPPPRPAEVTTSKPPLATLPAQGSLEVPVSTPLPPMTDPASIGSPLRVGDSITAQITDTEGRAVPAVMVLTTASGGSTSAKLVPVLPVPAAQTDSGPTSTMTTIPPNLSVDEAANALWTTNTWITTTSPGGSEATVVPVLVGCPGCGGRGHGLVLWNLPKTPRVQFKFPGFPKVPRFHFPCIRVLGITIGSCSDSSKLPEIITDSPEPGDTESSDPQDENEDPDPDDEETDPDDERSSTASQAQEESTTITSSSPSPSSSSSSSCPRRVTMSDFTICSLPSLKAAVHHNVQETRSLSPATGTDNLPAVTHRIISVADVSSIAPLGDLGSGSSSNQVRTSMAASMLLPISVPALTPPPPTPSPPLILPSPPLTTPGPPLILPSPPLTTPSPLVTSLSPPPAEDPPADEPPPDEPPPDEPPPDEPPVEEPPVEETPPEEPQVEDPSGKDRAVWDMPADDVGSNDAQQQCAKRLIRLAVGSGFDSKFVSRVRLECGYRFLGFDPTDKHRDYCLRKSPTASPVVEAFVRVKCSATEPENPSADTTATGSVTESDSDSSEEPVTNSTTQSKRRPTTQPFFRAALPERPRFTTIKPNTAAKSTNVPRSAQSSKPCHCA